MYDELVNRMRDAAKMSEALAVLLPHSEGNATAKLYKEAADAIEAMCEMVATAHCELANVIQSYEESKPSWIPVTERLPEPTFAREWYLVSLESGCVKTLAFEKEGRTDNLFRPGWHETASPVTHWMPLPEPPKGE